MTNSAERWLNAATGLGIDADTPDGKATLQALAAADRFERSNGGVPLAHILDRHSDSDIEDLFAAKSGRPQPLTHQQLIDQINAEGDQS